MLDVLIGWGFAIAYGLGLGQVGRFTAQRWLRDEPPVVRFLAAMIAVLLVATLVFHLLLPFFLFGRLPVLLLVTGLAGLTLALERRDEEPAPGDEAREGVFVHFARIARPEPEATARSRWMGIGAWVAFGSFVLVTLTRAVSLPTVGWDSITYHYVKAGMWVQTGGPIELDAPGGWSMYRAIFGGGEIFTAWAMLPFGNDTLAGAVDGFFWLALALALYGLGREFGLAPAERLAVAVYALFVPAIWDAVGWGYVDLTHSVLLLSGLLMASRYFQTLHFPLLGFAMVAFGLAAGIKLTGTPILAAAGSVLLIQLFLRSGAGRPQALAWFALGGAAAVLCVLPWLVQNLVETGYPLRFPMTLFGVRLGEENAAFAWSQDRSLPAYEWAAEFEAVKVLFQWPWVNVSHLGAASLLPLALAPVGALRILRGRPELRSTLLLAALICAAVLVAFYDRAFSFSRLEFWWGNGRFLQILVCLALPLGLCAFREGSSMRRALMGFLWLAAAAQCIAFAPLRFLYPGPGVVFAGFAVGFALCAGAISIAARFASGPARGVGMALLALVAVTSLDLLRETDTRYRLLVGRNVSDDVFRYWWQAGHLAEREGGALRIAVTAGPRQDADNWLMYYFLGADLQNSLHYLPISTDGEIIAFGPEARRRREGDVDAWLQRLAAEEITHVLSFFPTSIELEWMETRPDRFLRLVGTGNEWAFYRVVGKP